MDDITIIFPEPHLKEEISDAVLIEGLPGIGHIGKLVAEHMIGELKAKRIATIHSLYFPPQVLIEENGVVRLVHNEIFHYRSQNGSILFLVGDYQSTSNEGHYLLADAYLNLATELGVKRIYTLGGFGVGRMIEEPRVLAAVNNNKLREEVISFGAEFEKGVPGGGIVGAAGLLLGLGGLRGIDGICLMGETSGYIVDPKSASSLLRVLSGLLGIEVDSANLEERALEMEQLIERLIEGEKPQNEEELRYIG